jgi:hypothetical protein
MKSRLWRRPARGLPGRVAPRPLQSSASSQLLGFDRFNVAPGERDPLLTTENSQQYRHPLQPRHAGINRKMALERTGQQADRIPRLEPTLRELDGARSRPRISSITTSGTFAGCNPSITSRLMPGHQRARCHCSSIQTKQYPGKSGASRSSRRPRTVRRTRGRGA